VATTGLLYQPQIIDDGDCGAIGGMKSGRETRSTRRKPAPVSLCPPQIPHDQTPVSNPGRRGGKPATNRLSYGAAGDLFSSLGNIKVVKYGRLRRLGNIAKFGRNI
jgi:hypothetical protein